MRVDIWERPQSRGKRVDRSICVRGALHYEYRADPPPFFVIRWGRGGGGVILEDVLE